MRIDRLIHVDPAFDQFQRAMLLSLLADQQATITAAGLKHAGLKNGYGGQAVSRDLPAVESFEEFEQTASRQFAASRRERDGERIKHPASGSAVARKHRLRRRAMKNRRRGEAKLLIQNEPNENLRAETRGYLKGLRATLGLSLYAFSLCLHGERGSSPTVRKVALSLNGRATAPSPHRHGGWIEKIGPL